MTIPETLQIALHHHRSGRLAEAEALYRQILAVQPKHGDALHLLGVVAQQVGRHDMAVEWICQALVLDPSNPAAHSNLGESYRATGRLDEAIAACHRALQIKPDFPEAHNNLGSALRDRGRLDEAVASYRSALQLRPDYPQAHNNLGNALRDRGQVDEAIASYRRALHVKPDYPAAQTNLGNVLLERGQLDEAIALYRRALQLKPDLPEAHNNLGSALRDRGEFDEAIAACRRALELKPCYPEACYNLGNALRERGQLDEAIGAYRRAIKLKPDYLEAHNNLGNALKDQGELDDAMAAFRDAFRIKPDDSGLQSNVIYTLHFHPRRDDRKMAEERERWSRRFSDPVKQFILPHANDPATAKRLRVGYVSPDFRDHVVGRNLLPLFQRREGRESELLCYAGVLRPDQITEEFRRRADHWRSTVGVGDEALAEMIRGDGVDILVDLTQHMAGNRLGMFARKPAPVQVSFAGYPESTGLDAIEYRISDRHLERGSADDEIARKEQVYLIDSFWCYDPGGAEVEVNGLPAAESGRVTFGSLNNFCKVNEPALRLWARALGKVTHSRLILRSGKGSPRQRAVDALEREGIDGRRVEFVDVLPLREYLEMYHKLDIVLDTFPYNGHTTSLDALWMGVPVVSLAGATAVSRAGLSQLTNLGLPELVAHSEDDYVRIAVELAADLPRLAQLRSTLRERMRSSVLMDAPRFTRQVEQAYRMMWRAWCHKQSPIAI